MQNLLVFLTFLTLLGFSRAKFGWVLQDAEEGKYSSSFSPLMTYNRNVFGYMNTTVLGDEVCFSYQLTKPNFFFGSNYFWFSAKGLKTYPKNGKVPKFWLFPYVERNLFPLTTYERCFNICKLRYQEKLCSSSQQLDTTLYIGSATFIFNEFDFDHMRLIYNTNQPGNVLHPVRKHLQGKNGMFFSKLEFGCEEVPTLAPTTLPTTSPTEKPTPTPSLTPSAHPVAPSTAPTERPTSEPAIEYEFTPTVSPTKQTAAPSKSPSNSTDSPSAVPSGTPSLAPSGTPSLAPSGTPSRTPSETPSLTPSRTPSLTPSGTPSGSPLTNVTEVPSSSPLKEYE